ncbi:Ig-like domain-containing protein [Flavobacterium sp.]|uniref:Ig-like domain-containing protein n=1 Tax=Flavobacterium sp. TaxID=239 RepID=UPI00333E496E
MKNTKINYLRSAFLMTIVTLVNLNCEREVSDEAQNATFAKTAEVFTDAPVGMGTNFYFPYGPDANNPVGSKFSAWSVDSNVSYKGNASMRFDVPNATDPQGNYAGGILRVDGAGRDLTGYDALTFWAKASQGVTIGEIGFGEDFYPNKYITTMRNISLGTAWTKYIIPIPNASKLVQEKGMFRYSAGTQGTNGFGYTFWIDELKFEKLGTILPLQASIMNGNNITRSTFVGVTSTITGALATFNMPNGMNQSVSISPAFLNFTSSNTSVATVNDAGVVTPIAAGTATITATFNGQPATGSLIINCSGAYVNAPIPTLSPSNVISIFSDVYTNVPVNYYNGYWQPWQTTLSNDFSVLGDNVLNYTNFNFVGIEFSSPTVNANSMTLIHLDAFIPGPIAPGRQLRVLVVDFGANGVFGGGDDTRHSTTFTATTPTALVSQNWISIEIPFSAMTTLASRSHLAQIILEGGDNSIIYVDNIYFHN